MSTHDYAIANASGATVRADINNALLAIVSNNSSATAPSPTFAHMFWADTAAGALKKRNAANTAWITLFTFDETNGLIRIDFDKGADIASASTTDIGAATGNSVTITGTTTITGLGTIAAGAWRLVTFAGALILTHNPTSLILPGGANITTVAGDMMWAESLGSGNWRVAFFPANGSSVVPPITRETEQATTSGTAFDFTGISSTAKRITIMFEGVSLNGAIDDMLVQIGDSGGIEATGYVSTAVRLNAGPATNTVTTGFNIFMQEAAAAFSGHMTLTNIGGNTWISSHSGKKSTANANTGGGDKTLSGVLDRVRLTRTGSETFDAGSVNIIVE